MARTELGAHEAPRAVVVYSYGLFDYHFFNRLRPGLSARGWTVVTVTHLLSVWLRARWSGHACILLRPAPASSTPRACFNNSHERRAGLISAKDAGRFETSALDGLERAHRRHSATAVALWNGLGLGGQVATHFAKVHGLARLYVELGNLDSKLFIDPEGVNAASLISRQPETLDTYGVTDAEIEAWRADFIGRSRTAPKIPQAVRLLRINPWFLVDRIGAEILRIPRPITIPLHRRLLSHLRLMRRRPTPCPPTPRDYVFLPLQVSTDTNLLLFSQYDNQGAIEYAARLAGELGVNLVVKPHPAERDTRLLARLAEICSRAGHTWTCANTTDLLLGARRVVTINSTVGLLALALDRPTTILGDGLYSRFTQTQAVSFVMRHLVDMDPYGRGGPSRSALDRIVDLLQAKPHDAG